MENFTAYNPTRVHFGQDVCNDLSQWIAPYGKRVLLMYGRGSIKRNGIYDKITSQLHALGADLHEYSGIKPNPQVSDVNKAAELGSQMEVDVILAVGGGSVIDSAKITSLSIANNADGWDLMKKKVEPKTKIPLISVLTLAATASEMNKIAVLQNNETREKFGFGHELNYPDHSFLDPRFTYTVPREQTAYGIADLMAHTFESFFGDGESPLSDRFVQGICKVALEYGPKVLQEPQNYEYRANIMWAATNAMNGLCAYGKSKNDGGMHAIGHNMSVLFDTPHAATLTIAIPAWLKLHKASLPGKIQKLGKLLFDVSTAEQTISELEQFYRTIGCPVRLSDIGLDDRSKDQYLDLLQANQATGRVHKLNDNERKQIVAYMDQ